VPSTGGFSLPHLVSDTRRYQLTLTTRPNAAGRITATATVVDTTTSATVATVSSDQFPHPEWYDVEARRFGFGGTIEHPAKYYWDDFLGTAN
jgi:hypothetical protein